MGCAERTTGNQRGLNGSLDEFVYWSGTTLAQADVTRLHSEALRGGVVM